MANSNWSLEDFVRESNHIERIDTVQPHEIEAHERLLARAVLTVPAITEFVHIVAGAPLRSKFGMNVYIGNHVPPFGSPDIVDRLDELLRDISENRVTPYAGHVRYETLHPYSDGNGRSGRAIWMWHMNHFGEDPLRYGFLHWWYYQSLDASR